MEGKKQLIDSKTTYCDTMEYTEYRVMNRNLFQTYYLHQYNVLFFRQCFS